MVRPVGLLLVSSPRGKSDFVHGEEIERISYCGTANEQAMDVLRKYIYLFFYILLK